MHSTRHGFKYTQLFMQSIRVMVIKLSEHSNCAHQLTSGIAVCHGRLALVEDGNSPPQYTHPTATVNALRGSDA